MEKTKVDVGKQKNTPTLLTCNRAGVLWVIVC